MNSKRHHQGAALVHVELKDAGHGLVGGDDAGVVVPRSPRRQARCPPIIHPNIAKYDIQSLT